MDRYDLPALFLAVVLDPHIGAETQWKYKQRGASGTVAGVELKIELKEEAFLCVLVNTEHAGRVYLAFMLSCTNLSLHVGCYGGF